MQTHTPVVNRVYGWAMSELPDFPRFSARAPWWGSHLQTVRNMVLLRTRWKRYALDGERVELATRDGDRLTGLLNRATGDRPLAVLVHGLTGCAGSTYMIEAARHLLGLGYSVLRLNMRGAGDSAPLCRQRYHAGRGEDIADALAALDSRLLARGVVLTGYSLGGNILINFLARHARNFYVRAAATVSAPIDLAEASVRMLQPVNRPYSDYLLRRMKSDWSGAEMGEGEYRALAEVGNIFEFDDRLVAAQNGFDGARGYYAKCSGKRFLHEIETPVLLIHAANDPWIPARTYTSYDWQKNPRLTPLLPPGGGHLGFHAAGSRTTWHDHCIAAFFGVQAG